MATTKPKLTPQTPGEQAQDMSELSTTEVANEVVIQPVQSNLPDESEINPYTITRPVLSQQGWVIPCHKEL